MNFGYEICVELAKSAHKGSLPGMELRLRLGSVPFLQVRLVSEHPHSEDYIIHSFYLQNTLVSCPRGVSILLPCYSPIVVFVPISHSHVSSISFPNSHSPIPIPPPTDARVSDSNTLSVSHLDLPRSSALGHAPPGVPQEGEQGVQPPADSPARPLQWRCGQDGHLHAH